jgi:hypothetical protein
MECWLRENMKFVEISQGTLKMYGVIGEEIS